MGRFFGRFGCRNAALDVSERRELRFLIVMNFFISPVRMDTACRPSAF